MTLGGRRFLLSLAIVAASVCLALGVSLPIIKLTKFVFFTYEHSLISTVNALIRSGQVFLGITVLMFSIVLPVLKLLYLLLLSTLPQRELRRLSRQLRALEWLGKWSMHDVLVLSLSIFFIKSQGVYDAKSLNGVYFFTAAVLFMILAYAWLRSDVVASQAPRPHPSAGTATILDIAQLRLQLPHHPGDSLLRARRHAAGHPLHDRLRVDQPALRRHHHLGALSEPGILPVFRDFHVLDLLSLLEAVLSAYPCHLARPAVRIPARSRFRPWSGWAAIP